MPATLAEIDTAIAAVRERLRELTHAATDFPHGDQEISMANRIEEQEQLLAELLREREILMGGIG